MPTPHSEAARSEAAPPEAAGGRTGGSAWWVLTTATALLLLASAALKAIAMWRAPVRPQNLFETVPVLSIAVAAECVLAALLLSGRHPHRVRWLTLATFLGFAIITGWKAAGGLPSCGCFGWIRVDPRITLILDLLILAAFAVCRPRHSEAAWRLPLATVITVGGLALGVFLPIITPDGGSIPLDFRRAIAGGGPAYPSGAPDGAPVLVDPEAWLGTSPPWSDLLTAVPPELEHGDLTAVFWVPGVPPERAWLAGLIATSEPGTQILPVAVGPLDTAESEMAAADEGSGLSATGGATAAEDGGGVRLPAAAMRGDVNWIVPTVTVVRLASGRVVSVRVVDVMSEPIPGE